MRHLYEKVLIDPHALAPEERSAKNSPRVNERNEIVESGLNQCREITKKYGTSYYFATQFFPGEIRDAIYAVYAFARIPDEIVDDPKNKDDELAVLRLEDWRRGWLRAMRSGRSDDPVMAAIVFIFQKYEIPISEGEAFLRSMFMDKERSSYANYSELEEYMYGSAGVIGLMVTRIVGYYSEDAFPYAKKLGYAFQLTNFLRDIKEDANDLGRVYMPVDELAASGLSVDDINSGICDDRFIAFMKTQIARNREIYREALPGIDLLKWRGRFAVRISYVLYKEILREIEKADHNVFAGRVRTSFSRKIWLSLRALVGIYD
ncbi:MAG: phytoene/squalene synthase family protein [Acidobacteria bacterium]|nr:phytoene/squalene synthase family protein [Acidobacteriota bacterium]